MKKLIKTMTSFVVVMLLLNTVSLMAFAEDSTKFEFGENPKGSVIVDYRHDDTPLDDIQFKVYHITTLDENDNQIKLPKYEGIYMEEHNIYDNEYWLSFRDDLENFINFENIEPEQIFYTDDAGSYHVEDLELGIYFIQAEPAVKDGRHFFSEPILIMVGHYDNSDELWIYHYRIKPKIMVLDLEMYNVSVQKIWENTNSELLIPREIEVELRKDGKFYDKVKLSKENNWSYTWNDIDPCATWAVKELTEFEDFEVHYEKDILSFKIKNTYTGEEEEELPQTGTFAYLIPILLSAGLVLVLLGVLLQYKFRYKEND